MRGVLESQLPHIVERQWLQESSVVLSPRSGQNCSSVEQSLYLDSLPSDRIDPSDMQAVKHAWRAGKAYWTEPRPNQSAYGRERT